MNSYGFRGFEVSSVIKDADIEEVWDRVETWTGVNYELGPLLRMTIPKDYPRVSDIPADGNVHFTSYIMVLGILPIDAHRLSLQSIDPPHFFDERSSNFMMRVWTHRRTLEAVDDGVRVTDRCTMQPRAIFPSGLMAFVFHQVFKRRHRRLVRYYARKNKAVQRG